MPDRGERRAQTKPEAGSGRDTALLSVVTPEGRVPSSLRDVSFSSAVRGYDRREVDSYVKRVNGVIAELEISQSPESAVKNALDRVGEQTAGVLQRAREAAEQLTATAVAESEHATRRARVEAGEQLERAHAEAEALRKQSAQEAEEVTATAEREAAERLARVEAEITASRKREEVRLAALTGEIAAATDARARALEQLGRIADQLAAMARRVSQPPEPDARGGPDDSPAADAPRESGQAETVRLAAVEAEGGPEPRAQARARDTAERSRPTNGSGTGAPAARRRPRPAGSPRTR